MTSINDWIKSELDRTKISQRELAKAIGMEADVLNKILSAPEGKKRRKVSADEHLAIEAYFKRLDAGTPPVKAEPEIIPEIVSPRTGNAPGNPDVPEELRQHVRPEAPLRSSAKNVPIWGYGKGGNGGFFIDQGALVGMTYRPNMLEDVPDAYAIEIWDHSMHPALKHGHVALVHPHKTPLPGDEVVVVLTNGESLIKELVRRTEKTLTLLQHNPPEEIRIDRNRIKKLHLIVDSPRVRL